MNANTQRLFIGLPVEKSVSQQLSNYAINRFVDDKVFRVIPIENHHITLAFLGDVSEQQVHLLDTLLREVAAITSPFDCLCGGLEAFPSNKKAKVIAAQIASRPLMDLYERIKSHLNQLGFDVSKRTYRPHLSIVRAKTSVDVQTVCELDAANTCLQGRFAAKRVVLYKSEQKPGGSEYSEVFSHDFIKA